MQCGAECSEDEPHCEIESGEAEGGGWRCVHCTLLNDGWRLKCRLCQRTTKRQAVDGAFRWPRAIVQLCDTSGNGPSFASSLDAAVHQVRVRPHQTPHRSHGTGTAVCCICHSALTRHLPLGVAAERGEINESLQLFQAATCLNPNNIANLKQVGRSLYLLARHKAALDVYEEALRISSDDWEIWHNKGAPSPLPPATAIATAASDRHRQRPPLRNRHAPARPGTLPGHYYGTTTRVWQGCATCT